MFRFGGESLGKAITPIRWRLGPSHLACKDSPPNRSSIVERIGTYRGKKCKQGMEEKSWRGISGGYIYRHIGPLAYVKLKFTSLVCSGYCAIP
jgi:hypothetical protein